MPNALPEPSLPQTVSYYRRIIDSTRHCAIIGTDLNGKIISWNAGATHILGWNEAEVIGQEASLIFTPEDRAAGVPLQEMRNAIQQGYANDERWHMRKSGERFWSVGELTSLVDEEGILTGFVKILRDRTGQKQAETQLLQLNETLEMLVEQRTRERDRIWRNSLDLLLVIDRNGIFQSINPAWTRLLGYQPDDLIGKHFEPFTHPDDVQAALDAIASGVQGPMANFEVRIRHKEGQYRWIAWTSAPEEGLIYANGRDITLEKQQAQQLERANQARLRLALEAGGMGVWEWDMRDGHVTLLEGTDRLHGLSTEPGKNIVLSSMDDYARLLHPDDRAALQETVIRAFERPGDHRLEYRVIWPDRSVHWLDVRGTVQNDEQGKPALMVGVSVDITRRKKTELNHEFLAQASAELADLVDPQTTLDKLSALAVPAFADWCAIDLLNEAGEPQRVAFTHSDPEKLALAHDLYRRFPPGPQTPHGPWRILHSGQASLVSEITDEMLAQNIQNQEYLAGLRELGIRSYIGVPLQAHGKTLGVVTFVAAESHRRFEQEDLELACELARRAAVAVENANLYRCLQDSDRGKDIFLATLAHELRNPLAAVMNGLSILKLAPGDQSRVEKTSQVIERQLGQLGRLVDDLMDISRITTGKIELKKENTSLVAVINQAVETSRPLIEAAHHQLVLSLPGEPTDIQADPVRLSQVFANLLNNAAKYTNPGGRIELNLECIPAEFIVSVKDNGIGVAPDMLGKIFTLFMQGQHPLERSHGGLGIGLSLVDGLVRMHGGRIEAFSAGIDHGTEVKVVLPRLAGPAAENADPGVAGSPGQTSSAARTILVVDDNVDAAETIGEILEMLGHNVTIVHDGLAAVSAAQTTQPDLILLDIGLPGIDGYEAAQRIRRQNAGKRPFVIALTGWGQAQDRQRAFDAGFDYHLVKPINLAQLQDVLAVAEEEYFSSKRKALR